MGVFFVCFLGVCLCVVSSFSSREDSCCFDSLVANTVVLIMHHGVYN